MILAASAATRAGDPEPGEPAPSARVGEILAKVREATPAQEALQSADRALALARELRDAAGEAAAHRARARALERLERHPDAVTAWREAAAAWERGGDGPGRIEALGAVLRLQAGEGAPVVLEQVLALARAETRRPVAAAGALQDAGVLLYRAGRPRETLRLQGLAEEILEKAAPGSRELAGVLENLATVQNALGERGAARERAARSLALREKLAPDSLAVARSLTTLAAIQDDGGDTAGASRSLERALAIQERLAPESLDLAATLDSLSVVAVREGNLPLARRRAARSLEIRERLAPGSDAVAGALERLGAVAQQEGALGEARRSFQEALAIREKLSPGSFAVIRALTGLGHVADDQGDTAAALSYYERALAIAEKAVPGSLNHVFCLSNLGMALCRLAKWNEGRERFEEALRLGQKLAPGSLTEAALLSNLAVVIADSGDPKTAEAHHRRALELREAQAPGSPQVVNSLANLGVVARQQGEPARAETFFRRAAELQERIAPDSMTALQVRYRLTLALADQEKTGEAEQAAARAWKIARSQAEAVSGDDGRVAYGHAVSYVAAGLVSLRAALGNAEGALAALEESRAQALQIALGERRLAEQFGDPKAWAKFRAEAAARNQAEQALAAAGLAGARAEKAVGAAEDRVPDEERNKLKATADAAEEELKQALARYVDARARAEAAWEEVRRGAPRAFPPPLSTQDARRTLAPGQLLAAFSVGEERSTLLLCAGSGGPIRAYPLAIKAKELEQLAQRLIRACSERSPGAAAAGRSLFQRLFPEQARSAVLGARRLLISPDGPLWGVPFAALVTNASGAPQYLGADRPIAYAASLTVYSRLRREPRPRAAKPIALVLGDPAFEREETVVASARGRIAGERSILLPDGESPGRLPASLEEARQVGRLYGAAPLLGAAATEEAVRARIGAADVVHLATHGYLHPTRPMSSGLLLAAPAAGPAPDTGADGALLAWEIMTQLKLRAELVVLAACESGRGATANSEGLVGLTRALQYAGARSIVASRWRVSDTGSRALMVALHRNLRRGMAKDEALRQAAAAVRANPGTAHPYYWAPFFLIGDPENPILGVPAKPPGR
jgi:CHAT domain-containing protein/Tfp pilus assembly protein PilF